MYVTQLKNRNVTHVTHDTLCVICRWLTIFTERVDIFSSSPSRTGRTRETSKIRKGKAVSLKVDS